MKMYLFLKGRLLVDGAIVVNELVDLAKNSKKNCFMFKVDFQKVYNSVSSSFMDYMLSRFGLNIKWTGLICAYVFTSNLTVLVNDFPTQEISIQKGLKQGDPLAPFLFLMVAEGLSGLFSRAVDKQIFTGLRMGSSDLVVSHHHCMNDTIIMAKASYDNIWFIKTILRVFELVSGLRVNFVKSNRISSNPAFLGLACDFLHYQQKSLSFIFLAS